MKSISNNYLAAQKNAFKIFLKSAKNCKAYQSFLNENELQNLESISYSKFQEIPITDKNTYFRKYPLMDKLYRNKRLSDYYMICTSSGSTGEPTIWPRDFESDNQLVDLHTDFLDTHFSIRKKKTLILIAFGLGSNTAGMLHARLSWEANKNGNVSVISPGLDAEKTIFLLESLYQEFEQVVCIGYPPCISEFVQLAIDRHIEVKNWHLKIAFTSESVSRMWRNEMVNLISETNSPTDVVAFYASTEAGIIGIETPVTHQILACCLKNESLIEELFQSFHLPTLVEVNFMRKFVEVINGEVVITIDQSFPLVRYNLHDKAKFVSLSEIRKILKKNLVLTEDILDTKDDTLFLAVFGRNEHFPGSISFQIEDIRFALESSAIYPRIHSEFQYKQIQVNENHIHIYITVYQREPLGNNILLNDNLVEINSILQKLAAIQNTGVLVTTELNLKDELEMHRYQSGKLHYFSS